MYYGYVLRLYSYCFSNTWFDVQKFYCCCFATNARRCFYKPRCQTKHEEKSGERVIRLCKMLYSCYGFVSYYPGITVAGSQYIFFSPVSLAQFNLVGTLFDLL